MTRYTRTLLYATDEDLDETPPECIVTDAIDLFIEKHTTLADRYKTRLRDDERPANPYTNDRVVGELHATHDRYQRDLIELMKEVQGQLHGEHLNEDRYPSPVLADADLMDVLTAFGDPADPMHKIIDATPHAPGQPVMSADHLLAIEEQFDHSNLWIKTIHYTQ